MKKFDVVKDTVYRWKKEAQQGKNRFPLPISFSPDGTENKKSRLRWRRREIEEFCQARTAPQPAEIVSVIKQRQVAKSRHERNEIALRSLQSQKVKTDVSEE
jgi:transposase-like protein